MIPFPEVDDGLYGVADELTSEVISEPGPGSTCPARWASADQPDTTFARPSRFLPPPSLPFPISSHLGTPAPPPASPRRSVFRSRLQLKSQG
ncbi:hypothetical protein EYF80_043744 [Liparis tanakae]|uniref:Uncharacterized protein n=1 Tax=Liparis tanakae TaxID=230148 RepID=A0A4Z2FYW4_9TELE|nr:hypothetical protein EYF80_043744 [Liparis tanakae]